MLDRLHSCVLDCRDITGLKVQRRRDCLQNAHTPLNFPIATHLFHDCTARYMNAQRHRGVTKCHLCVETDSCGTQAQDSNRGFSPSDTLSSLTEVARVLPTRTGPTHQKPFDALGDAPYSTHCHQCNLPVTLPDVWRTSSLAKESTHGIGAVRCSRLFLLRVRRPNRKIRSKAEIRAMHHGTFERGVGNDYAVQSVRVRRSSPIAVLGLSDTEHAEYHQQCRCEINTNPWPTSIVAAAWSHGDKHM